MFILPQAASVSLQYYATRTYLHGVSFETLLESHKMSITSTDSVDAFNDNSRFDTKRKSPQSSVTQWVVLYMSAICHKI